MLSLSVDIKGDGQTGLHLALEELHQQVLNRKSGQMEGCGTIRYTDVDAVAATYDWKLTAEKGEPRGND